MLVVVEDNVMSCSLELLYDIAYMLPSSILLAWT